MRRREWYDRAFGATGVFGVLAFPGKQLDGDVLKEPAYKPIGKVVRGCLTVGIGLSGPLMVHPTREGFVRFGALVAQRLGWLSESRYETLSKRPPWIVHAAITAGIIAVSTTVALTFDKLMVLVGFWPRSSSSHSASSSRRLLFSSCLLLPRTMSAPVYRRSSRRQLATHHRWDPRSVPGTRVRPVWRQYDEVNEAARLAHMAPGDVDDDCHGSRARRDHMASHCGCTWMIAACIVRARLLVSRACARLAAVMGN